MKIIAVANQKGGCGKTTTAINLAACLGKKGRRVLLLDLDPQGHSSLGFGVYNEAARDLYDVFTGEIDIEEIILPKVFPGVDVIPATPTLAAAEHLPVRSDERDRQLEKHLSPLRARYDFVVLDCPPAMGLLSLSALAASDLVLIPIEMSLFGLHGIDRMYETIRSLRERHGKKIVVRILPTLVDSRTRLCRQFLHEIGERFADDVLSVMVQFTVRLKEAVRQGRPIVSYDPTSTVAVQYDRLASQVQTLFAEADAAPAETGMPASTTRSFGAAAAGGRQRVVLRFYDFGDKDIKLAGSFNDWRPDQGVITRSQRGIVEKILMLMPGTYEYRLIVDGVWQEDPSNPEQVPNYSGGFNSVLQVEDVVETESA